MDSLQTIETLLVVVVIQLTAIIIILATKERTG